MDIATAASFFDKLVCDDAYTPGTPFLGQFGVYDDSVRDGLTVDRRILSVAPTVTMPARGVMTADSKLWLIGQSNPDYFLESAVRHKYVVHAVTGLATIKTFAEAIAGSAGTSAYASKLWAKGTKEVEVSSDVVNVFSLYFAAGEPVAAGKLVSLQGRWFLVRDTYAGAAELLVATTDELPEPVIVSATFSRRTYVPATDSYTTNPLTINGVRIRWQSYFEYRLKAQEKHQPGDVTLVVVKSALTTPLRGDQVVISGDKFAVVEAIDDAPCWALHLRNA